MITYLILAILFFVFSLTLFSYIIFVIYKNKECKMKEVALKKEINSLNLYDFEKINAPIEHICFRDERFEKIMFLFTDFASMFDEKKQEAKNKVYKLPKTLNNYDWKAFKKIYNSAFFDVKTLKSSLASLFEIQQKILEYKDYVSYILVSYRENSWNLIDFYNNNLAYMSDDSEDFKNIKKWILKLREDIYHLNNCIECLDINEILLRLNNVNSSFSELLEVINQTYISKKQDNYINYSIHEISSILNNNYRSVQNHNIINEAEKSIHKVRKNMDYVKSNRNSLNKKQIQKTKNNAIKMLWKIRKDLNLTFKSSEFFNKNKQNIDKSFQMALKYIPELTKKFNRMYDNFIDDRNIKTEILECNTKFFSIIDKIKNYFKLTDKKNYDPPEMLNKAKKIIHEIIQNINFADEIYSEIVSKYDTSRKILNDITANKLLLIQMHSYIIKNKIKMEKSFDEIDKLLEDLNEIEQMFFSRKWDNDFCVAKLAEVKSDLDTMKEMLLKVETLKHYTEKVINYACLKMVLNPSLNYKLDKTISLYDEGKYKDGLMFVLVQLKK